METEIPDFWRTEVFHPLSVHFPIVLLLAATLFLILALFSKKNTWKDGGLLLLVLGVIGAWVAIYTGDLADGIVSRKLCDPTVLKDHENLAYTSTWIFTAALILQFASRYFSLLKKKIFQILTVIILVTGCGFLTYVGHLGATLVYQQAAGVNIPSSDCSEFN